MEKTRLAEIVIEELEREMGATFEAQPLTRSGVEKLGIVRTDVGSVSPVIYVEDIHEQLFEAGLSLGEVVPMLVEAFSQELPTNDFIHLIENGERPPDETLTCRVLPQERIKGKETELIYRNVADDLCLVLDVCKDMGDGELRASLPKSIYGEMADELFDIAMKNITDEFKLDMFAPGMYIVTNPNSHYGAAMLFGDGATQKIADQIGDYYALPSSVHEFIIVPMKPEIGACPPAEDLKRTVREANRTVVNADEVLSDNVYAFVDGKLSAI